jgi:hypothetical protein
MASINLQSNVATNKVTIIEYGNAGEYDSHHQQVGSGKNDWNHAALQA